MVTVCSIHRSRENRLLQWEVVLTRTSTLGWSTLHCKSAATCDGWLRFGREIGNFLSPATPQSTANSQRLVWTSLNVVDHLSANDLQAWIILRELGRRIFPFFAIVRLDWQGVVVKQSRRTSDHPQLIAVRHRDRRPPVANYCQW